MSFRVVGVALLGLASGCVAVDHVTLTALEQYSSGQDISELWRRSTRPVERGSQSGSSLPVF